MLRLVACVFGLSLAACTPLPPAPEAPGIAETACAARRLPATEVQASVDRGMLKLPATINGQPVRLVFDTGANATLLLWENTAERLGLAVGGNGSGEIPMGMVPVRRTMVSALSIGSLTLKGVGTAVLPERDDAGAEGHLGVFLLDQGDLLHRLPESTRVTIIDGQGCQAFIATAEAGGAAEVVRVPVLTNPADGIKGHMLGRLVVEGVALNALIDTGATLSFLTQRGYERLREPAPRIGSIRLRLIDGRSSEHGLHGFDAVAFGGLAPRPMAMAVIPESALTAGLGVEAIIGADILFAQPALFSSEASAIYFLVPREP